MRTTLNLAFLAFFFIQISFSQEINYKEVTQIIIGEYHSEEDVLIIKEEIESSNKQKIVRKLLKMNNYLNEANETVNINGNEISKACSDLYIARDKHDDQITKLKQEVQLLNQRYKEIDPSNYEITQLNKKAEKCNLLIREQNEAIDNFRMCMMTQREVVKDFDKIIEELYLAYKAFKAKKPVTIAEND